jgi:transcriptional activator SPT7
VRKAHAKFTLIAGSGNAGGDEDGEGGEGSGAGAGGTGAVGSGAGAGVGAGGGGMGLSGVAGMMDGGVDVEVDESPWLLRGSRHVHGVDIGGRAADQCLRWVNTKMLEHVGFQGTSHITSCRFSFICFWMRAKTRI